MASQYKSLYDTIVSLKVGPSQKTFSIHKALLCHHSYYFKAALTGNFKEAQEGTIVLDDEDPQIFERFNEWIYSGKLLLGCQNSDTNDQKSAQWSGMLNLYVFAEKRIVPQLQNDLIDAMLKYFDDCHFFPDFEIGPAWTGVADTSPLHTFLVDLYVFKVNLKVDLKKEDPNVHGLPVEFVVQVAKVLQGIAFYNDTSHEGFTMWGNRCKYHVHGSSDALCKDGNELGLVVRETA